MGYLANTDALAVLHRAIDELSMLTTNEDIFEFMVRWLRENTQGMLVGLAQNDRDNVVGKILKVRGEGHILDVAERMLGHQLVGSPIMVPLLFREKAELNHATWGKHIYPTREPSNLGIMFGVGSVYGYPIPFQGTTLVAGFILKRGQTITTAEKLLIELIIKQVSLALNRVVTPQPLLEDKVTWDDDKTAAFYIENGTVIHCNAAVKNVFGLEQHQVLNKKVHSWLPKEMADTMKATASGMLYATSHEGKEHTMDVTIELAPNLNRTIEMHLTPLKFPAGKTIVQVTATDVTEQRRIETALQESETRYRELFDTSTEGISVTNQHGYYLDCNPAFLQMLGYDSVDEVCGMHFLDITPEEYHSLDLEQNSLLDEKPYVEFEKEYIHKNKTRILVWIRLWKRLGISGELIGRWALVRDITTIRRMETAVGHIEQFKVLGELAAAISHEIRNPLTTVRGFLQLLPLKSGYSEEDKDKFKLMISEIDLASTIIKDFLDLARPAEPRRAAFSMTDLLTSLIRVLESKAIILRVNMSSTLEPALTYYGDSSQLRQVFLNLIQNAFQSMPEGGTLTVSAKRIDEQIVIDVTDTGVGIPPSHLARLGRPFFTTKPGGTGMGLTTCYRIVAAHHGKIDIRSQEGVGTTFSVVLPSA